MKYICQVQPSSSYGDKNTTFPAQQKTHTNVEHTIRPEYTTEINVLPQA